MMAGSGGRSPIPNTERQGAKPESWRKKHCDGGWLEASIHVCMNGLILDVETATEIRCRPSSTMSTSNISDGNKRSHHAGMNAFIKHLLDGRRPQMRGSAISDTLIPTSCTSRMVGDSERDPLHSALIHPVIGKAATAQHTISH